MAEHNDFACAKGEAFVATGTHKPVPTPITGWTIVFTLKQQATDVAVLLTKACTLVDAINGVYRLSLTHTETNRAAGRYAYDIWRTDAGNETQLSYGSFTLMQDVLY